MERILIAGREEELAFLLDALDGEYDLVACPGWSDAEAALAGDLSLVLCGAHFHDGHLHDFARLAKSDARTRDIPFYGVVVNDADFSRRFIKCLRSALCVLGADGALDLAGLRQECGDAEACAMLRTALDGIVAESARLHGHGGGSLPAARLAEQRQPARVREEPELQES